jgi:Domain of unknown function (DUF4234)
VSDMTMPPPEEAEPTPPAESPPATEGAAPVPAPPPPLPPDVSRGGSWGPPGKIRSWGVVAILTIITCGIYGLFWQYYVFEENKRHSGDGVGGVVGVILAFFVGVVNIFLLPTEIKNIYEKAGQDSPVRWTVGLWNLIPIVGWFIWLYKVQTAINERWEEMGAVRA